MSDAADPRLEIVPNRHRVRVIHRGITYADSHGALTVREAACRTPTTCRAATSTCAGS